MKVKKGESYVLVCVICLDCCQTGYGKSAQEGCWVKWKGEKLENTIARDTYTTSLSAFSFLFLRTSLAKLYPLFQVTHVVSCRVGIYKKRKEVVFKEEHINI